MLRRKMLVLVVATGALIALSAPGTAQAVQLAENGTPLTVGADVTATSTNFKVTTAAGTLVCESTTLHSFVANNVASITLMPEAATMSSCSIAGAGLPVTVNEVVMGEIVLGAGAGSGEMTIKYEIPSLGVKNCHLAGGVLMSYELGSSIVKFLPTWKLSGKGPAGCATAGEPEGEFVLETMNGEGLEFV
jgi:hypothetical protein